MVRNVLVGSLLAAVLAAPMSPMSLMSVAPPPASAAVLAQQAPPLIEQGHHDRYLSPDGDGHHERARFVFRLAERAYVRALVRNREGDVVRAERLGVLGAGRHVWRWNGRSLAGKVQPEGDYTVVLRATAGRRTERVAVTSTVLTHPDAGRLLLSRTTVYPKATLVTDRLHAVYVRDGYSSDAAAFPGYYDEHLPLRTRLVVEDPDGGVVFDETTRRYRAAFEWTARVDGVPLPPGDYRLRMTVRDPAGNLRTLRRIVTLSSAQLVERVWTATIPAADADLGLGPVYDPSCNGCGEVCGPVPSERFPGGLSFRQPCSFGYAAVRYFGATPSVVPAPVDSFRVTATGGPTTPGSAATASFDGVVMGPGDATASTSWQSVDLRHHPYVPGGTQPVDWNFSTSSGSSYDVASFAVEYKYYVAVSPSAG